MSNGAFTTYDSAKQAQIAKDFMDFFRANERRHIIGEFNGAKFNENKNKWIPKTRTVHSAAGEREWLAHLSGEYLLGLGTICEDNKVWFACLDYDVYEIDYAVEMAKIKRSGLPIIAFRTKSGGMRATIFFTEPIEAELVVPRMKRLAAQLGYGNCEIFPKQTSVAERDGDGASCMFMPYGGTGGMYAEQGAMNDSGNLLLLAECHMLMLKMRITPAQFFELFKPEDVAKANGRANGRKHPKGAWVAEDTYESTINTMFCDGPPCLWTIAHNRSSEMQNNFLLNVRTFLMRKYSENWDKALEWVNYNVLQPVGDNERLHQMIRSGDKKAYEYLCKQEPICAHCNPHACRRMPYGVGEGNGVDHFELGLVIENRVPQRYWVNVGAHRVPFAADELLIQQKYKIKCLEYGVPFPVTMKKEDWENLVRRNIESATRIDPSPIMRTGAAEIELLTGWFGIHVPNFLRLGEKQDDAVRVRVDEQRIYFKWQKLALHLRRAYGDKEATMMREYIATKCQHHEQKDGYRLWWRSTFSVSFDVFEPEVLQKWLAQDVQNGQEGTIRNGQEVQ